MKQLNVSMRKLLLCCVWCGLASTVAAQTRISATKGKMFTETEINDNHTDVEAAITGKVKAIQYKDYDITYVKKAVSKTVSGSGTWQFDTIGHVLAGKQFDAKGVLISSVGFKYSGKKLVEWYSHDWNASSKGVSHALKYYVNGRKWEDYAIDSANGDITRQVYQYDDKGFVVTKTYSNGVRILHNMAQSHVAIVDQRWCFSDTDANHLHLIEIAIDLYDSHHNHTESLAWGPDSVQTKKYKATFDANGNNTLLESYIGNEVTPAEKTVMKYDAIGQCKERIHYYGKEKIYKMAWEYDAHYNRVEQRYYAANGKLSDRGTGFHTYEYDAKGNVTKRSSFSLRHGIKVLYAVTEYLNTYY